MRRGWLIALVLTSGCGCRPAGVTPVELELRAMPGQLSLGRHWTQTTAVAPLTVINDSRGSASVELRVVGDPRFQVPERLSVGPGDNALEVSASADVAAELQATLQLLSGDTVLLEVPLAARFVEPPDCGQASECSSLRFDRQTSQCVFEARPDGLACGAADRCLRDGRCARGECVGQPVVCDDADPCTVDVCETVRGCVAVPRVCPDPGPCQVGVCVPDAGCGAAPRADGARCGNVTNTSCTAVEVCVNGACVERDPPDGFLCAMASPCQGEGRCDHDVCVVPPARLLPPAWVEGELREDGGLGDQWTDVFVAADGGVVLSSYFGTAPMVQAPVGPRLPTSARRCIAWNELVVCADTPAQGVTAVNANTGLPAWVYANVLADLPSLALSDWETFLARLVALGPSRLGVLYESRRIESQRETNCRRFSLVVLDDAGQRVVARLIDDPIFLTCNHPHSYGVAADPQGNVFFAFTPSANTSPALPDPNAAGTVIMSYSPAGVRRWRHFIPNMPGGEIAVGRGLITVEAGRSIYDAARGVAVDTFSIPFGEGLIADDWVVAGPKGDVVELRQPGVDGGVTFASVEGQTSRSGLRGAHWAGAPIALRLSERSGSAIVEAWPLSRFQAGVVQPLWTCEVPDGGSAVSFEVKAGALVIMSDPQAGAAGLCENCDPPWALTRSRFLEAPMPGLGPARMPWPGPWGGPGHDHQED